MTLAQTLAAITPANVQTAEKARQKWNSIAKPLGSLGLLEEAVVRMCAMTENLNYAPTCRKVVVFCADNGVVAEGVTQAGSEVTAIVANNLCTGATSVCKMAAVAHAEVVPVDMGMNAPIANPRIQNCRVMAGTNNMAKGAAMMRAQAVQAIEYGIALAENLSHQGANLFATGEMGIGNTTTSSAVASVLLRQPIERMTGTGAGLSQAGLLRKINAIETAVKINQPDPNDALDTLAKVGGLDIAGMTGFFLGAALCKKPCMIDGFISAVAALIAVRLCGAAADYMIASHVSAEPAGMCVLDALGLSPMITAGMRLGEGTGAVAAMPLLDMACSVFHSMSTFEDIQIEAYQPL